MSDDDMPDFLREEGTSPSPKDVPQEPPAASSESADARREPSVPKEEPKAPSVTSTEGVNEEVVEKPSADGDDDIDFLSEPPPPPAPKGAVFKAAPPPPAPALPSQKDSPTSTPSSKKEESSAASKDSKAENGVSSSPESKPEDATESSLTPAPAAEKPRPPRSEPHTAAAPSDASPEAAAASTDKSSSHGYTKQATTSDADKNLIAPSDDGSSDNGAEEELRRLEEAEERLAQHAAEAKKARSREEREAANAKRAADREAAGKKAVEADTDSLFSHAMGIRARHLEALRASKAHNSSNGAARHNNTVSRTPEPYSSSSRRGGGSSNGNSNGNSNVNNSVHGRSQTSMANTPSSHQQQHADNDDAYRRGSSSSAASSSHRSSNEDEEESVMTRMKKAKAKERRERRANTGPDGLPKPKYSYLSPEHLLRHEEAELEERQEAKRARHRNEQTRLRNLAIAREREQMAKDSAYESTMTFYANATVNAARDGADPPIHGVNVTTTNDQRIKGKLWFPTGRHGGRNSQHKPPLGYGALPPPAWASAGRGGQQLNNSGSNAQLMASIYGSSNASSPERSGSVVANSPSATLSTLRGGGGAMNDTARSRRSQGGGGGLGSTSKTNKSDISPLQPFDEQLFETITLEKVKRREEAEHAAKWSHIRTIQEKRAESVKVTEERKRARALAIEAQLQEDVVAAQAEKDRRREEDQQFAFQMRALDRERREKISAYKEERAKAVLNGALELRMEALRRAEDQERYDRAVKREERGAADAQRAAHLLTLQAERDKKEAMMAKEDALRAEFEGRTREYAFAQAQERAKAREAKLSRVDRQIKDKLRHRAAEAERLAERQYEADHMYSTLLRAKRPLVVESRGDTALTSTTASSSMGRTRDRRSPQRGAPHSGGTIDDAIAEADRENASLHRYYHHKA